MNKILTIALAIPVAFIFALVVIASLGLLLVLLHGLEVNVYRSNDKDNDPYGLTFLYTTNPSLLFQGIAETWKFYRKGKKKKGSETTADDAELPPFSVVDRSGLLVNKWHLLAAASRLYVYGGIVATFIFQTLRRNIAIVLGSFAGTDQLASATRVINAFTILILAECFLVCLCCGLSLFAGHKLRDMQNECTASNIVAARVRSFFALRNVPDEQAMPMCDTILALGLKLFDGKLSEVVKRCVGDKRSNPLPSEGMEIAYMLISQLDKHPIDDLDAENKSNVSIIRDMLKKEGFSFEL